MTVLEAVPMTDEQRFFFDLKGWITLPGVLAADEVEEMKAAVYGGATRSYEAPMDRLLDHPAIVGILTEILADESHMRETCHPCLLYTSDAADE